MQLTHQQIRKLKAINVAFQKIIETMKAEHQTARQRSETKNRRRRGNELATFRKMILAERQRGASVTDLAKKHGITASYIYQLRD